MVTEADDVREQRACQFGSLNVRQFGNSHSLQCTVHRSRAVFATSFKFIATELKADPAEKRNKIDRH